MASLATRSAVTQTRPPPTPSIFVMPATSLKPVLVGPGASSVQLTPVPLSSLCNDSAKELANALVAA